MLRVGLASVDITPSLGTEIMGYFSRRVADDVRDPLEAVAFVADDGERQIAIVALDLCVLLREDADSLRAQASELTGIDPRSICITCSHTHQGPATVTLFNTTRDDAYVERSMKRAATAVRLAQQRLRPVKMGCATGRVPEVSHNRRWWMRDGSVIMHPAPQSPDRVRPAGPDAPEMLVVGFVDAETSQPVAALVNYALHYVGTPAVNTITADYAGVLRRSLEKWMGGDFRAIYVNGACGDIFWVDTDKPAPQHPTPFFHIDRIGRLLAGQAMRQWNNIVDWHDQATVAAAWTEVPFKRREATPQQMEQARQMLAGPPQPDNREWVYANELMRLAEEPIERPVPIQALRVGPVGFAALPGEVFAEIGIAIKRRSPFPFTVIAELANGWFGYIPTDVALVEGSYETRLATVSKAAPGTASAWETTALRLLEDVAGQA
ncbi:MAG: neutral/alkaline non-lysosomal ceramidase N-terminal domain-containing protein [Armatimonadetes bacterium]|nr:neutral/alkaline non-lysosomal ceramidase N-terminal domain-containing protein [Armatimonadota bacterium]